MMFLALLLCAPLCAPCALPSAQEQSPGFENLTTALEQRTALRRSAAQKAWKEFGPAYLLQPAHGTMEPLLAHAPEIQEPLLEVIRQELASTKPSSDKVANLLMLLKRCLNPGGATQLLLLLPEFKPSLQPEALRAVISHGGQRTLSQARSYLEHPNSALRQTALESLLLHLNSTATLSLLEEIHFDDLDLESFGAMLDELALRPLPASFRLPADAFSQIDRSFLVGLVNFLTLHPQENAEGFLLQRALDQHKVGLSNTSRLEALHAYEAGAKAFRWRNGVRQLSRALKEMSRSPLSLEVAWTLHRLGERAGRNYLLDGPAGEAKRNPDSWSAQFTLAHLQVEVGEFLPAYRIYRKTLNSIEGTNAAKHIVPEDYLFAARAAAGAKHPSDAGQWLLASRMRPKELAQYRDLPEFQPYLKKPPFSRLFQVAD